MVLSHVIVLPMEPHIPEGKVMLAKGGPNSEVLEPLIKEPKLEQ
jgi:hypothetical protein